MSKFIDLITWHKCVTTQGAAWVNMCLIFFMGGVSIQGWCEKHFDYAPNVLWPVMGAVAAAWLVGYAMMRSGIIRAEQTFYSRQNDVLDEIKKPFVPVYEVTSKHDIVTIENSKACDVFGVDPVYLGEIETRKRRELVHDICRATFDYVEIKSERRDNSIVLTAKLMVVKPQGEVLLCQNSR